jgi:hypothetical protein
MDTSLTSEPHLSRWTAARSEPDLDQIANTQLYKAAT